MKALPVCWMLMQKKSAAAYQTGLQFFKTQVASHIVPDNVMTDFESGLKAAIRIIYPEAHHNGCFFHFCQVSSSIYLKIKNFFWAFQC